MYKTILIALISAIVYAGSMFLKKNVDPDNPQDFDAIKFVSTLVVSVIIAATLVAADVTVITESMIETQLVAYAGLIALVENVLKILIRKLNML